MDNDVLSAERIRPATHADIPRIAVLAAQRRREYERYQPVFWHEASDALARHAQYLARLTARGDVLAFVHEGSGVIDGFIIGQVGIAPPVYNPGGPICTVDDFVVADATRWRDIGASLLGEMEEVTRRDRGCILVVVVCGAHDTPKQAMLHARKSQPASQWWVKPLSAPPDQR